MERPPPPVGDQVPEAVRDAIERDGLLQPGETVLAAVSGGADSVALLRVLLTLGWRVEAAHLDHMARGAASAGDAAFVQGLAEELGVRCHVTARDVPAEAASSRDSFAMAARRLRYDWLAETARARGIHVIATGHHADDQAETVLMRVLGGSSPAGLAGIPIRREKHGIRIVRPLLRVSRRDILDYLAALGQPWREDVSNAAADTPRGRVRHAALPALRDAGWPHIAKTLSALAERQQCENALLGELTRTAGGACRDPAGGIRRKMFAQQHEAIQRRLVAQWMAQHDVRTSHERIAAGAAFIQEGGVGKCCDLGGGFRIRNARALAWIEATPEGQAETPAAMTLPVPGAAEAFGRRFNATLLDAPPPAPLDRYCDENRQVFDAAAVEGPILVRSRKPGDRFRPLGLGGSKKLKDCFIAAGVPRADRDFCPVLTAKGEILWAPGLPPAHHARVTEATRRWLVIEAKPHAPE